MLRSAGHDVETPFEVVPSLAGADDTAHFDHARQTGRILVTYNIKDFVALHGANPNHAGVFVVYQQNDVTKDMSPPDIVAAIANVETVYDSVAGQLVVLNYFQW